MKNLRQVCKNCNFHSQRNIFEYNFFWNTLWVRRFCSSFGWKNFSRFVRIAVYVCQRNIVGEKEKVFFGKKPFILKIFWTSGEKFIDSAVTFHSNFQEEQFALKLLFEKKFSIQKVFRVLDEKFLARLSKLHSISSEEPLWRTRLFEKT